MKLIGTEVGRVVALMMSEDWRPQKLGAQDLIRLIQERYTFVYAPNHSLPWEEVQKGGLKFQLGKITIENRSIPIQDMTFWNDGIVINASNTKDAEEVLENLFILAHETLGVRDLKNTGRRLFLSNLVVEFDQSINSIISKYSDFSETLNKFMEATYSVELPMQVRSVSFHYDELTIPPWIKVAPFSIDRRLTYKYSDNRFFCEAPLRSEDHLKALELFENILSK